MGYPQKGVAPTEPPIEFYIGGISLSNSPTLDLFMGDERVGPIIELKIDAHNSDDRKIQIINFKVAFLTSGRLNYSRVGSGIRAPSNNIVNSPEGDFIHLPNVEFSILPGGWESMVVRFQNRSGDRFTVGDEEKITLRMLSEYGGQDYPFKIKFQPQDNKLTDKG